MILKNKKKKKLNDGLWKISLDNSNRNDFKCLSVGKNLFIEMTTDSMGSNRTTKTASIIREVKRRMNRIGIEFSLFFSFSTAFTSREEQSAINPALTLISRFTLWKRKGVCLKEGRKKKVLRKRHTQIRSLNGKKLGERSRRKEDMKRRCKSREEGRGKREK